ncbi:phage minor capsid protein [Corynebacterium liangguodongii]|uniref:Minor capsid protein n=1 Tax=Corynebacterium liangguodongii TaxID=2079535 RepID=A0A2S0WGD7_9CORY|nr:phage minor capsid protein [Corynebacterium liangguodongii]AWB84784.1 minor capsid protein [Corynebacterium liangguodongii]PWB99142.1 minor capsid protein [Corynebacterium liangguodongii]
MYNPDVLDTIGGSIVSTYEKAELYLIRIIRDALLRVGEEPNWAVTQLLAIRQERHRIQGLMTVLQRRSPVLWASVVDEAYTSGVLQAEREIGQLEQAGLFQAAPGSTVVNDAAVTALASEGVTQMHRVHANILRRTEDAWRRIAADAAGFTTTGAMTVQQATQRAFTRMARDGMGFFVDDSGRKWGLDTYAHMVVRTATTRALLQGHTDTMLDRGVDLVVVSSHPRPAPVCAPYERKVLSLTGKYPRGTHRIGDSIVRVEATLREAEAHGLHHPNCRHRHSAYVPGITNTTPPQPNPNHEGYKATQKQRRLEREIRASKRMEEAALSEQARMDARQRTRTYQQKLREHIAQHDLPRYRKREQLTKPGGIIADF